MDRNVNIDPGLNAAGVALLAEGVDRNTPLWVVKKMVDVALLAEGVDRNLQQFPVALVLQGRPPRRGRG